MKEIIQNIPQIEHAKEDNFFLLAGPCVVESLELCMDVAHSIKETCDALHIPYVFKSSFKKANRSKSSSFTGIGDFKALKALQHVKESVGVPIVTDIHSAEDAKMAAEYVDILQIPAFLSRQTDILLAAAETGKHVNVKKGQFLSAEAMQFVAQKLTETGNENIMLTERGNMYGYHDMIVDYRNIVTMKSYGFPVIMDVTHSLQQPNQSSGVTGGIPEMIETIARAAIAVGADGLFIETHPNPSSALSDGANMLQLDLLSTLLKKLVEIRKTINNF